MPKAAFLKKVLREILIFGGVYTAWSIYIDVQNLHANLDNEALVPCLFFLPPIGLYIIYFITIKYGFFGIILYWVRRKKRNL